MTDPTELRRLAEAATPGPWTRYMGDSVGSDRVSDIAICDYATSALDIEDFPEDLPDTDRAANAAYIAAMHPATTLALLDEINELRSAVITFCGPWAVEYAQMMGLPPKHIYAVHYDLLAKCGARMVDFVRHDNEQ